MTRRRTDEGEGASTAALFGEVLRHFREAAFLTQEALARQIPCDRPLVAHVESGARVPQETFAKKCDELLGTGGVLMRLWVRIDWYPQVEHPDWFRRRAEMDAVAVSLREFEVQLVPGLLQTVDYARALLAQKASGALLEERVNARLSRQISFHAEGRALYVVVMEEGCLKRTVGSPAVMRDQCQRLLSAAAQPNILLHVTPAHDPEVVRFNTAMSLIELPDGQRWVYSESIDRGYLADDPIGYARHSRIYDVLRADARSVAESVDWIRQVMEEYEQHGQLRTRHGDLDQEQLQRRQRRQLRRSGPRIHPGRRPRA